MEQRLALYRNVFIPLCLATCLLLDSPCWHGENRDRMRARGWNNKGYKLSRKKRYEQAIIAYDRALAYDPTFTKPWFNKGVALHALKRFEEALATLEDALTLNPNYAVEWRRKAIALGELKRYDEAVIALAKALEIRSALCQRLV